jgi:nicotinate phosphoribosyltransferase
MSERIIHGLFDIDYYKLTMGQFIFFLYRYVRVRWQFKNRTGIPFAHFISLEDLKVALEAVRQERFDTEIIDWLEHDPVHNGIFRREYLDFLRGYRLPSITRLELTEDGRDFVIESEGEHCMKTYWETCVMAVKMHLYQKAKEKGDPQSEAEIWVTGEERLYKKIDQLKRHPELTFVDFGMRRRRSFAWQRHVLEILKAEIPDQLLGTSNVRLAYELGITPLGTSAHELPMMLLGLLHAIDTAAGRLVSQEALFKQWKDFYGFPLSTMLTDTFGTPSVLENPNLEEEIKFWRGSRQDSGDPHEYAAKWVQWYKDHGVDPKTKTIIFSDGLTVEKMIELWLRWSPHINVLFGWGTNLMNDLGTGGLSIVMKVVAVLVNGEWIDVGKLTDNRAKAIGTPECIARMKRLADYTATFSEDCRY